MPHRAGNAARRLHPRQPRAALASPDGRSANRMVRTLPPGRSFAPKWGTRSEIRGQNLEIAARFICAYFAVPTDRAAGLSVPPTPHVAPSEWLRDRRQARFSASQRSHCRRSPGCLTQTRVRGTSWYAPRSFLESKRCAAAIIAVRGPRHRLFVQAWPERK